MTLADLQKILRAADPAAVLVSPRILERVIREDCKLPNMYWNIPHVKSYVCDRHQLWRHAEQADLDLEPDQLLPDIVILLARPDAEEMNNLERKMVLLKYWRRLFHSRVHLALGAPDTVGPLTQEGLHERIAEIGLTEFEEVRTVLFEDNYLPPEPDDRTTYMEFAAVFLEMRYFAANLLPNYFPGLRDFAKIERLFGRDLDAAQLFASTRLRDAPDPIPTTDTRSDESQEAYWRLVRSAQGAALSGNLVGAAILRMRASRIAPAAQTLPTRNEAEADIARLSSRLAAALGLKEAVAADWTRYLTLLLDKADQGARPTEAKVLEDLQKVCLDHEQDVYTLDLVEYLMSGGKRPIKRPLPSQRLVRISKHLRSAAQKLGEVRLSDTDRSHLARLLEGALRDSEEGLRARFEPVLVTALEDVGLRPSNPIEQAAFDKMVSELLDRMTSYGFLTFAELRDTISRNQFKLNDLSEPEDFIRGDPLIRLDRRLGSLLDGVYRPSEFYTRWLERGTSILFGTGWGRALSRYVFLPLLCAWLTLYVLGLAADKMFPASQFPLLHKIAIILLGPTHREPAPTGEEASASSLAVEGTAEHLIAETPPWIWHLALLVPLAIFFVALIQSSSFRRQCLHAIQSIGRGLAFVFWRVPLKFLPLDTIRLIISTWVFQLLWWYVLKPGLVCALLAWPYPILMENWLWGGAVFFLALFMLNSRIGRAVSESMLDALTSLGTMVRAGLIPGLFRFTLQVFKQIVEFVEYILFVVDEWLRFRSGGSRTSLVVRTVLGVVWYPIAFLARFYMVVLIEPCLNPLKLPISILAAKFVYPWLAASKLFEMPTWTEVSSPLVEPLARVLTHPVAWILVVGTFYFLPDAFAFLTWELKENWNLYRANRSKVLEPVGIGAHGETLRGLLQPGFHSGTIPRLYARLRKAERLASRTRNWHTVRAYQHEVRQAAETLRNFVSREMVALLNQSRSMHGRSVDVAQVHVATNRVCIEFLHADYPAHSVEIEIEYRNGWLMAGIRSNGWLESINEEQRRAFCVCLAGLYKRADVDIVREQLQEALPGPLASYQLNYEGLLVWTDQQAHPLTYALRDGLDNPERAPDLQRIVFARTPIRWDQWVRSWQDDQDGLIKSELPSLGQSLIRLPAPAPPQPESVPDVHNGEMDGENPLIHGPTEGV